jgi:hypothetical protein
MMEGSMAKRLLLILPLLTIMAAATPARAEDEALLQDARISTGYQTVPPAAGKAPSAALTWMLLGVLGLVCVGPMFLNAKRTHLD